MRTAMIVMGLFGVLVVAIVLLLGDPLGTSTRTDGLRPAPVTRNTPVAQGIPLPAGLDLVGWSRDTADRTAIPARALRAYAAAELDQRAVTPDCRLSWTTLAGIGRVESDHGRWRGTELGSDGVARPPIIGVQLDGSPGVAEIRDTDGGRLDGDPTYDRAVGPLQFLPATWARYGGNGDPQNIDDAARAAAAYLCAKGRDTASGVGWWDGVLTYNRSVEYAQLVWAAANRYATAP
ncbi:lytic murein transglycosylase [Pseudonocardia hispaniensis]|uniref:Lytic murein transglycosylase n=1 Tax=Pseudonocardia hispaniensis TaxID=904933 RepID=A0ABW1IZ97_9PSEU